ncbi:RNA polymerase sigma factor 70, region 4 type 2 domain protein [Rhodopirellula sallentina SM41]|uniref:RNA polymerase sigma factor 70, region 4 type 2 domain protein n=1 Tax=Rhodopirellula sallentina SM41 TaxID=1263870 RepID=M5U722_9BACT|nr:RNA polymerase sigma factor 70, region 4 type 2 domain protein [Rhodopirellula sallentina SM41]
MDSLGNRSLIRLLEACIGELPEKNRDLLVLHYQKQMAVAEISAGSASGVSTVYERLHKIRTTLSRCIHRKLAAGS